MRFLKTDQWKKQGQDQRTETLQTDRSDYVGTLWTNRGPKTNSCPYLIISFSLNIIKTISIGLETNLTNY